MPRFSFDQLVQVSVRLLRNLGASDREAQIVGKSLARSNLFGVDSHGVIRLIEYADMIKRGQIRPRSKFRITNETFSTALIDGNWGFGQVVAAKGMNMAIDKAKKNTIASTGIFNCSHVGRLAEYTMMAADEDMIGIMCVKSDPCVAPVGGAMATFGTNPLSVSIPNESGNPIVVDFATAMVAEGKIRSALLKGERIPLGWIIDSSGHPTSNPADLYGVPLPPKQMKIAGAILPFGGYKGYGVCLVNEILGGIMTGSVCNDDHRRVNGAFMTVVNPGGFVPITEFRSKVGELVEYVKSSPKAPGVDEILIPGEPEFRERGRRIKTGIPIASEIWNVISDLCKQHRVDLTDSSLGN